MHSYVKAMECINRSLPWVRSFSNGRMCELRKSGEVCVEAFDFVIILIASF